MKFVVNGTYLSKSEFAGLSLHNITGCVVCREDKLACSLLTLIHQMGEYVSKRTATQIIQPKL